MVDCASGEGIPTEPTDLRTRERRFDAAAAGGDVAGERPYAELAERRPGEAGPK
jgi:hypothetical protein